MLGIVLRGLQYGVTTLGYPPSWIIFKSDLLMFGCSAHFLVSFGAGTICDIRAPNPSLLAARSNDIQDGGFRPSDDVWA